METTRSFALVLLKSMEDELAIWRGCGDVFGAAAKADVSLLEFSDNLDELLEGASQSVELPDDQNIAASYKCQCLGQSWSF